MKKCIACNKDISHKRKNVRFCSLSCSTSYNRLLVLHKDVPANCKKCGRCRIIKKFEEFRKNKNSAFGYSYFCKCCDKQRVYTRDRRKVLLNAAKKRSKDYNLEFNLDLNDIILPRECPILGIELQFNKGKAEDNSYSIDRIDNNKGYIKGNVQIISFKANTIKSNANFRELELVYKYMKQLESNSGVLHATQIG
jgi:hypothetical protein